MAVSQGQLGIAGGGQGGDELSSLLGDFESRRQGIFSALAAAGARARAGRAEKSPAAPPTVIALGQNQQQPSLPAQPAPQAIIPSRGSTLNLSATGSSSSPLQTLSGIIDTAQQLTKAGELLPGIKEFASKLLGLESATAAAEGVGTAAANAAAVPASLSGGGLGAEASAAIPTGGITTGIAGSNIAATQLANAIPAAQLANTGGTLGLPVPTSTLSPGGGAGATTGSLANLGSFLGGSGSFSALGAAGPLTLAALPFAAKAILGSSPSTPEQIRNEALRVEELRRQEAERDRIMEIARTDPVLAQSVAPTLPMLGLEPVPLRPNPSPDLQQPIFQKTLSGGDTVFFHPEPGGN